MENGKRILITTLLDETRRDGMRRQGWTIEEIRHGEIKWSKPNLTAAPTPETAGK